MPLRHVYTRFFAFTEVCVLFLEQLVRNLGNRTRSSTFCACAGDEVRNTCIMSSRNPRTRTINVGRFVVCLVPLLCWHLLLSFGRHSEKASKCSMALCFACRLAAVYMLLELC